MALHEGSRRLRKAGKYATLTGVLMLILAIGPNFVGLLLSDSAIRVMIEIYRPILPILLSVGWFASVVGALLWLGGWILEGFATPQSTESDLSR